MKLLQAAALSAVVLMAAVATAQDDKPPAKGKYKTEKERMSYALGFDIGRTFADRGVPLDIDLIIKALKTGYAKDDPDMTVEEIVGAFQSYKAAAQAEAQRVAAELEKKNIALGKKNKAEGEAFLAKNKKRKGVITDKSGLQYEILKKTKGESPEKGSVVKAHYHGTFIDGKVFDSSLDKQPLIIPVDGVIEGWSIALQKMKVGEKWKLYIPSELAYADRPDPRGPIPPNAALIFEVELIAIEKDEPANGESAPESVNPKGGN